MGACGGGGIGGGRKQCQAQTGLPLTLRPALAWLHAVSRGTIQPEWGGGGGGGRGWGGGGVQGKRVKNNPLPHANP